MVSPELIRGYPFFADLSHDQIVTLAKVANEVAVEAGHYFFYEGDYLKNFYLVLEGAIAIVIELPDQSMGQKLSGQLTGELQTKGAMALDAI